MKILNIKDILLTLFDVLFFSQHIFFDEFLSFISREKNFDKLS